MNVMADQRKMQIPEEEVEDVIAMASDGGGHLDTNLIVDAMLMNPDDRRRTVRQSQQGKPSHKGSVHLVSGGI